MWDFESVLMVAMLVAMAMMGALILFAFLKGGRHG